MVFFLSVLAAAANALATILQRRAARGAPPEHAMSARLVGDLLRRPVWFAGIVALLAAFVLQAAALHAGTISVVQPVLAVELPLTLLLAAATSSERPARRDWLAALAMTVGLAVLLAAGSPSGGDVNRVSDVEWLIAGLTGSAVIGVLVALGLRGRGDRRAALWGTASGVGYALTAAFMKAMTAQLDDGLTAALTSWPLYAMVVAGAASLFLLNNAVQAGRLVAAQPGITLADPLVGITIGVMLFDERIRLGTLLVPELLALALIAAGTVALAHSPFAQEGADAEPSPRTGGRPGRPLTAER